MKRLHSLDILRGLDIFILTILQPILYTWNRIAWKNETLDATLSHVYWEGFHPWDMVMPLFIFICGAAVPFAIQKYLSNGRPTGKFYLHILIRVAMLWIIGMAIQGNLFTFDYNSIYFFTNTLQAIAVGYVIAMFVYLIPKTWMRVAIASGLIVAYTVLLTYSGDYSIKGNLPIRIDNWCMPGGNGDARYSWVATSAMFGFMTLCGSFCGQLLKSALATRKKIASMIGFTAILGALGGIACIWIPLIKPIYTTSFTLLAMSISVLLLCLLYIVIDVIGFKLLNWLTIYGKHALFVYVLHELFLPAFYRAAEIMTPAFKTYRPVANYILCGIFLTVLLLGFYYRKRVPSGTAPKQA